MEKYVINIDVLVNVQLSKFNEVLEFDDVTLKQIDLSISRSKFVINGLSWTFNKEDSSYTNLISCFNRYIYFSEESISIFYLNLCKLFPEFYVSEEKLHKVTGFTFNEAVISLINKISDLFNNGDLTNESITKMIETLDGNIPLEYESFINKVKDEVARKKDAINRNSNNIKIIGIDEECKSKF